LLFAWAWIFPLDIISIIGYIIIIGNITNNDYIHSTSKSPVIQAFKKQLSYWGNQDGKNEEICAVTILDHPVFVQVI
jgi:5,10-methylenetetrahydrofolate reductase